jgi:hypothetical protein
MNRSVETYHNHFQPRSDLRLTPILLPIYKILMEGVTRLAETASIREMANREEYLITDLLVEGATPSLACRRQKAASPW